MNELKPMTLYVYRNVITLDKDNMEDYLFEYYAKDYKDVYAVETKVEYAWEEDVEIYENVTIQKVYEYISDCYRMLEYNYLYKEKYK